MADKDDDDDGEATHAEPTLEELLKQAGIATAYDMADPGKLGAVMAKMHERNRALMKAEARKFRECFRENAAGRKVLDQFLNMTLRRATWPIFQARNPRELMVLGVWNEAQNSFVAAIIEAIAVSENENIQTRG